jgi:hypothetical protein
VRREVSHRAHEADVHFSRTLGAFVRESEPAIAEFNRSIAGMQERAQGMLRWFGEPSKGGKGEEEEDQVQEVLRLLQSFCTSLRATRGQLAKEAEAEVRRQRSRSRAGSSRPQSKSTAGMGGEGVGGRGEGGSGRAEGGGLMNAFARQQQGNAHDIVASVRRRKSLFPMQGPQK